MTALLGVLVGALVAASAQLWVRRSQTRERWLGELLGHCAEIYALESASRGHAFDAVRGRDRDPDRPVAAWDVERRRQAEAAVFLLTTDAGLTASVEALGSAGRAMHQAIGDDAFEERAAAHAAALDAFAVAARHALRHRRVL